MKTFDKRIIILLEKIRDVYSTIDNMEYDIKLIAGIFNDKELQQHANKLEQVRKILTETAYKLRDFWVKH